MMARVMGQDCLLMNIMEVEDHLTIDFEEI